MREVISEREKLMAAPFSPIEDDIKKALAYCEVVADDLIDPAHQALDNKDGSAASALLSLNERATSKPIQKSPNSSPATQKYIDQLSSIAYSILLHPTIFITPEVLEQ